MAKPGFGFNDLLSSAKAQGSEARQRLSTRLLQTETGRKILQKASSTRRGFPTGESVSRGAGGQEQVAEGGVAGEGAEAARGDSGSGQHSPAAVGDKGQAPPGHGVVAGGGKSKLPRKNGEADAAQDFTAGYGSVFAKDGSKQAPQWMQQDTTTQREEETRRAIAALQDKLGTLVEASNLSGHKLATQKRNLQKLLSAQQQKCLFLAKKRQALCEERTALKVQVRQAQAQVAGLRQKQDVRRKAGGGAAWEGVRALEAELQSALHAVERAKVDQQQVQQRLASVHKRAESYADAASFSLEHAVVSPRSDESTSLIVAELQSVRVLLDERVVLCRQQQQAEDRKRRRHADTVQMRVAELRRVEPQRLT